MYNGAPQGAPAPEAPAFRRPSLKLGAGLYLWAVASLIGFSLFTPRLAAWLMGLFPGMGQQALSLAATAIYYLPCVLLPACLTARYAGSPEAARLGGMRPLSMLARGGAGAGGAFAGAVLERSVADPAGSAAASPTPPSAIALPQNTQETMLMVLSIGVLPGVCEELLFRGAMLGAFERLGTKKAIWMTAILFTLWHGSLAGVPAELLTGLLLGYVAFAFDSVYAAITYHTVYNTALVLINVYAAAAPVTAEEEALLAASTFEAVGGWPGVLALAFYTALLIWAMRGFLRVAEHRRRMRGIRAVPAGRETLPGAAKLALAVAVLIMAGIYALDIVALSLGAA